MDQIIIAASTHWDREWYRTFQEFQIRLCDMMNRLLDILETDSKFVCYTFDGQSVVLDDYLEVYPKEKERIQKLVKDGRLVFGPLYNLPDEFLSGGEALIRNFLIGEEVCREFGGPMKAGYVPDNFGHISQLPQILNGVGIETAFFFRGTNMDTVKAKEFWWQAPDGSKVLCEYMPLGYWSLKSWGKLGKSAKAHFSEAYEMLKKNSALGTFLLINGSDHLYQDPEFTAMVELVQKIYPELSIRNASVKEYADLMLKAASGSSLHTVSGELRDFRYGPDPTAVTSTRGRVKRLLSDTLAETERFAEPLAVIASQIVRGGEFCYPDGFFTKIWKKICISLGHDGICGCSTDEVMRDIETYLIHSKEMAVRISRLALEELSNRMELPKLKENEEYFFVFNPHPFPYTGITRQEICLEREETEYRDFEIFDMEGNAVPSELLSVGQDVITREFFYHSKEKIFRDKIELNIRVSKIPALGVSVYRIVRHKLREKRKSELYTRLKPSNQYIGNSRYRIHANADASLTIFDKITGKVHEGMNTYVSRGEIGDEYQHVSPLMDQHIFARMTGLRVIANGSLSQTLRITSVMELPAEMSEDMLGRSADNKICRMDTDVTLFEDENLITCSVTLDNACADHILYAKFPAGFKNGREFSYVGFDETVRDQELKPFDACLKSTQSILKPLQKYAGIVGEQDGVQLITKGLNEYHTKGEGGEKELYLTLLRSTSSMFHGLPVSWQDGQHSTTPIVKTPAARELGISKFEYALMLGTEPVAETAERYLYPPRGIVGSGSHNLSVTACRKEEAELPDTVCQKNSFIRYSSSQIGLSAIKKHKCKDGTIVRLFNRSSQPEEITLETMLNIDECWQCNLLEEQEHILAHSMQSVTLKIPSKKIITLYFSWR